MIEAIKALLKAQSEMGSAVKNSKNPHFKSKYADLEAVVNATMGAFHANGFAVLQRNDKDAEGHFVETKLLHSSGDTFDSKVYLVLGNCLLYTSDAADDMQCVDLGGRRIIK